MKTLIAATLSLLILSGCVSSELTEADRKEITDTFMATKDAWNAGDIEKFMEGYWNSEEIAFVGSAGPVYGYEATLKRYQTSYPDTTVMGKLDFEILKLYKTDRRSAILIGKFYLTRTIGDAWGHYTLVWKKINGKWVIITDHSSAAATN